MEAPVVQEWMREAACEIFNECILSDRRAFQSEITKIIAKHAPASPQPESATDRPEHLRDLDTVCKELAEAGMAIDGLRELAEQIDKPRGNVVDRWAILAGLERAMRLRDQAWRNSFGIVACPTEEKLNARMAELLKAETKP